MAAAEGLSQIVSLSLILTFNPVSFCAGKLLKMDIAWLTVERVKLRWPLHRAVEFFISAQLGHKWLQSRLNIVQAHRLGAEKRSPSMMLSTRPCLCIFADLCLRTPHITVCFISQTQNLWVNSNYKALQSKCCFLTIPALNL